MTAKNGQLTGLIFEHGHGSVWGIHFYINILGGRVIHTSYLSENTKNLVTKDNLNLDEAAWSKIEQAVQNVTPYIEKAPKRLNFFFPFKKPAMLDGGEFVKLWLVWDNGKKKTKTEYTVKLSTALSELEALLKELVV